MNPTTLTELQQHLDQTCRENGWDKNTVAEVFLLFNEEVGELAKEIRLHTGFKGEAKPESDENLREEFADVLNYLMELANRFNVDLTDAYYDKHAKNKLRNSRNE